MASDPLPMPPSTPSPGLVKTRIEALCDGVFAGSMTLMVFETKPPFSPQGEPLASIAPTLLAMWPRFATCALSLIILGVYWVGHHNQYHYIRRSDRTLLWINVLFCLAVAFIPFSASLLGLYPKHQAAVAAYGVNLTFAGLMLYAQWRWATYHHHLVDADLDPRFVAAAGHRVLIGPCWYAIAIAVSALWLPLSLALFVIVPLIYILPGRVDVAWNTLLHRAPVGKGPTGP